MRQILADARDAEISIDTIVVRLDVLIGDRPVLAVAVAALRLEVVVGKPERQASPDIRLSAEAPCAHPGVIGSCVRMLFLVDDDVLRVVGAAPALHVRIDLRVRRVVCIRRLTDRVLVERQRMVSRRQTAPSRVLVRPLGRFQVFIKIELLSRFEHQHLHALRRHDVRSHAAGRARPDHDGVVGAAEIHLGPSGWLEQPQKMHGCMITGATGELLRVPGCPALRRPASPAIIRRCYCHWSRPGDFASVVEALNS